MPPHHQIRRAHRKSRRGCQECKRRHIKCDESRPQCANCSITGRLCGYRSIEDRPIPPLPLPPTSSTGETSTTASPSTSDISAAQSRVELSSKSHPSTPSTSPNQSEVLYRDGGHLFPPQTTRHIELFGHFVFDTAPSLADGQPGDLQSIRALTSILLPFEYAVYQMLAVAALHLSHVKPAEERFYREEATVLQTHALSLFNNSTAEVTQENCAALLIFAKLLSLQALAEAVTISDADPDGFLDRYVAYLNLHRGVRAITKRSWRHLKSSSIASFLDRAENALTHAAMRGQTQATAVADNLYSLLSDADMNESSSAACREAISHLELLLQSELHANETVQEVQAGLVWMWPTLLSDVFTTMLVRRTPEALIILCNYAVLLHRRRHMWFVGSAGSMLIQAITRSLGTYWSESLRWPNDTLAEHPPET